MLSGTRNGVVKPTVVVVVVDDDVIDDTAFVVVVDALVEVVLQNILYGWTECCCL